MSTILDSCAPAPAVTPASPWHMHVGSIRLWIVGPGADAMHPASGVYYTGKIGTDSERAIARRTALILDREYRYNCSAGPEEIKSALTAARQQIRRGLPMPAATGRGTTAPASAPPVPRTPTPDDARRIIAAVEFVTGLPAAQWHATRTHGDWLRPEHGRARVLAVMAALHLFPALKKIQVDALLCLPKSSSSRLATHHGKLKRGPTYPALLTSVISKLS